jgi:hypothetical protein
MNQNINRGLIAVCIIVIFLTLFFYLHYNDIKTNQAISLKARIIRIDTLKKQILRYQAQSINKIYLIYDDLSLYKRNNIKVGDSIIKNKNEVIFKRNNIILYLYENIKNGISVSNY